MEEKIKMVVDCCQVGGYELIANLMLFKAIDSDCEHYFEEFNIEQKLINGETYNLIDLDNVII